ncbi:MAG: oligosaccharide flippase family protein, partial [Cyanobacteria bacterium REEB65]|nr:oligosaccharide flippase family protein [Cyanobacteria bacterium REEB65]
ALAAWTRELVRGKFPRFATRWVRPLLGFGACHVPSSLGAWITQLADRYLLLWNSGAAVVGVYSMGYRIGCLPMAAVAAPVSLAWPGYLARCQRRGEVDRLCVQALETVLGLALGVGLTVELFAPDLLAIFAKTSYGEALPIIAIVLIASMAASIQPIALSGVNLAARYGYYPLFTGTGAIANLALNAWWIPRAGALGAAYATAGAYLLQLAMTSAIAQHVRRVPFGVARPFLFLALAVAALGISHLGGASFRVPCLLGYGLPAAALLLGRPGAGRKAGQPSRRT